MNIDKLGDDGVHIWQVSVHSFINSNSVAMVAQYLSDEERLRADRYIHAADRTRFIIARGAIRVLLGRYLGINPAHILFEYGPHGKPMVAQHLQPQPSFLHFNLSHASDQIACIFTRNNPVGIDIECIRNDVDIDAIGKRFFSQLEFSELQRVEPSHRLTAFFNVWARKEAFIKAMGTGLFYSLRHFDVSVDPDKPAALLAIQGDEQKTQHWFLEAFMPTEGYVGAWVIERQRPIGAVQYYQIDPVNFFVGANI